MQGNAMTEDDGIKLTEAQQKRRRQRNIAIAAVLVGLVVLFYVVTVFKMGAAVMSRPM